MQKSLYACPKNTKKNLKRTQNNKPKEQTKPQRIPNQEQHY